MPGATTHPEELRERSCCAGTSACIGTVPDEEAIHVAIEEAAAFRNVKPLRIVLGTANAVLAAIEEHGPSAVFLLWGEPITPDLLARCIDRLTYDKIADIYCDFGAFEMEYAEAFADLGAGI